jgi:ATP-dependent DNA helicase 2 subunit 1
MWSGQQENEEDSSDDEFENSGLGKDHMIFLIDARHEMRDQLLQCMQIALHVIKAKIIASSKSTIGIIFYGTKNKNTDIENSVDNIYTLFTLDVPSASRIKTLQRLSKDLTEFDELIGSQENSSHCNLKESLWICCQSFNSKKGTHKERDSHRIWIFTNDDNPNANNPDERGNTMTIAKDTKDSGGEISLWYFGDKFNMNKFYKGLMFLDDDDDLPFRATDAMIGYTSLSKLLKKEQLRRPLASVPMILGDGIELAVQVFKTMSICKKPTPTPLYRPTNEPLKRSSRLIDYYGARVEPTSIKTYVEVAGSRVYFSSDEMKSLKFGERSSGSLKLVYCTSAANLTHDLNMQEPYFLYPNESAVKGSAALFTALLEDMHSKGLLGVAEFYRTRQSVCRMVALLPQRETVGDDGCQLDPPGFNMIPLPFASEIRQSYNPVTQVAFDSTSAEAVAGAEALVSSFQVEDEFDYCAVENPCIQKYYAVLQAVALSEEAIDWSPERDQLLPRPDDLNIFEDLFVQFKTSLGLADGDEDGPKKVPYVTIHSVGSTCIVYCLLSGRKASGHWRGG